MNLQAVCVTMKQTDLLLPHISILGLALLMGYQSIIFSKQSTDVQISYNSVSQSFICHFHIVLYLVLLVVLYLMGIFHYHCSA